MTRPGLDPALARKIDRLARRAHAFHRFAHHPLCGAYRGEVVALGRWRLCRGCLLGGAGLGAGLVLGGALPPLPLAVPAALAALGAAWAAALARLRPPKLLSRLLPAALAGFTVGAALRPGRVGGFLLAAGVAGILALYLRAYRRRGPHREACAACPERDLGTACSGYRAQVRRERAFSRLASRWIARGGKA
ncbi:hypothetical protein [Mesoterricola sediminis]|uniref:DUF2085 domain-containing protein n=1 Tax=Mesoterricola sediminis TaxID=2927980 RepID=A0AA48HGC3_9BACT|nr:hypothetical protein [Mesoterricola sediminis]BDU77703.1 hypothetical protein METESE_26610 [Mesoterricola sediminis]